MTPALTPAACLATAWQVAPDLGLRLAMLGGLLLLAGWAAAQRYFPGQRAFVALHAVMIVWLGAATAEHASVDLACKTTLALLAWPAILAQPLLWVLFLHQYTGNRTRPPARGWLLAAGVPTAALMLLALSNGWHGWLYGDGTRLGPPLLGLPRAQYDYGPLFYTAAAWAYGWLLAALGLVIAAWHQAPERDPRWPVFVVVMLVPWAANIAFIGFGWRLLGADPTPLSFGIALVGMAALVRSNRLFRMVPLARRLLFTELPDPVLVLDRSGRVMDANHAAMQLAGAGTGTDAALAGQPLADWPRLGAPLAAALNDPAHSGPLVLKDPPRVFELRRRAIGDGERCIGELVQLLDITERHHGQVRLVQALAERNLQLQQVATLQAELREQALRDPLTGLHNRRALEQRFADEAAHARATGQPLALVLLDLDHFKRINDLGGHAAGDEVLRHVGQALRQALRSSDAVFRIGGEEFALLLPGADSDAAADRVGRLQAALRAQAVPGAPGTVTFSAGIAVQAPAAAFGLETLMRQADAAMYRAKAAGRDRVAIAA